MHVRPRTSPDRELQLHRPTLVSLLSAHDSSGIESSKSAIRAAIAGPDDSMTAAQKLIARGLFKESVTRDGLAAFIDHARSRILESGSAEGLPLDDVRRESQMPALHLLTPMMSIGGDRARLGMPSLERSTLMLNGVMSTLREGSSRMGMNPLIREAYESFQADYARMTSMLERIQSTIKPRSTPIDALDIDRSRGGWMQGMAQLASYRKQLRTAPLGQMMQLAEAPWVKPGKTAKPMFHTFTQIGLDGRASNVFVRNTKDVDGRGATRVMSFVRPGSNGTLEVFRPTDRQLRAVTDAHNRVGSGLGLRAQLEEAQEGLARMLETRAGLEKQRQEALAKPDVKKAEGLATGIAKIGEKITLAEGQVRDLRRQVQQHEAEKAQLMGSALMLDLSYDELHSNLQSMCAQLKMSEPELASAMLHMLGADQSSGAARAAAKLNQEITLPSAKVKYLFDEGDFNSKPVRMNAKDLCLSLMSIMFLTEPKHALPMALANHDALRAIQAEKLSLEALFSPMNVDFDGSQVLLTKSGDQRAIGSLLASGNTFQSVLDPSTPGTRALKEQVMSTTEQLSRDISPEELPNLLSRHVEPQLQRSERARLTGIGGSSARSSTGVDPSSGRTAHPTASISVTSSSTPPPRSQSSSTPPPRSHSSSNSNSSNSSSQPSRSSRARHSSGISITGGTQSSGPQSSSRPQASSSGGLGSSTPPSLWIPEPSAKAQKFGGESEIQGARQTAFLFPFAKAITLRAMLLGEDVRFSSGGRSTSGASSSSSSSSARPPLSPQEQTIASWTQRHGKLSIAQVKNLMLLKPLGSLSIVAGQRERQQIADWINQNQWIKPYLSMDHAREQLARYGANLT